MVAITSAGVDKIQPAEKQRIEDEHEKDPNAILETGIAYNAFVTPAGKDRNETTGN